MRAGWRGCPEGDAMIEPLIGLAVAAALAVYLIVTLLMPERL